MRLNHLIDVLERGDVAAGAFLVPGNRRHTAEFAGLGYDFAIIETEHLGYIARDIGETLQDLIKPGETSWPPPTTGIVRIPANGREMNQYFVKQTLDQGAMGIVFPSIETVEQARAAVTASRYPQPKGTKYPNPIGQRGAAGSQWGLSLEEYYAKADVWPLNPEGELLLMIITETAMGVENLDDILTQVEGIGAVWAGSGDMAYSYGYGTDFFGEETEAVGEEVLAICNKHGVACFSMAPAAPFVDKRIQQGFSAIVSHPWLADPALTRLRELTGDAAPARA